MEERKKAITVIKDHLETVFNITSGSGVKNMQETVNKYEQLPVSYLHYQACHEKAKSPESTAALEKWHQSFSEATSLKDLKNEQIKALELPEAEREYRQSLHDAQKEVDAISRWNQESLPEILGGHQDKIDDFKQLYTRVFNSYSNLYTNLTAEWENAQETISEISSSKIMSEVRKRHNEEMAHPMLRPIMYHDIRYNTERIKAVFGMESTLDIVFHILPLVEHPSEQANPASPDGFFDSFFDIEMKFDKPETTQEILREFADWELRSFVRLALLTNPPLVKSMDAKVASGGIPREKISPYLSDSLTRFGSRAERLFRPAKGPWRSREEQAMLLTHRWGAVRPVFDIWRKWDFEHQRPLMIGEERTPPK
ncbi:hypothetical protein CPB86DRAFT_591347 [Serendipita vermifera]|nr:hypothetical protein CPB86DRAFT_591347 [Serendipita vermifera]